MWPKLMWPKVLWSTFTSLSFRAFRNALDLETWLKRRGVSNEDSSEAAPTLFDNGYINVARLLAASADDLKQCGLSLPLAKLLATTLQKPQEKSRTLSAVSFPASLKASTTDLVLMKAIKGTFPADLNSQKDYEALLQRENIKYLKNPGGNAIYAFAALVDGMVYTAGPNRAESRDAKGDHVVPIEGDVDQLLQLAAEFGPYRSNRLIPQKLTTRPANWPRVSRDECIDVAYERIRIRSKESSRTVDSKLEANAHVIVFASPGAGKSDFLDEIASLRPEDVARADPELQAVLTNLVAVCVEYSSATPLMEEEESRARDGLVLRIFYSFAFPNEDKQFVAWWDHCKGYSFSLSVVVEAVLKLSGRAGLLLCVDEVLKSKGCLPAIQRALGDGLDQIPSLYVFMTTLDITINANEERKTNSNRNIHPIPLRPLDPSQLPLTFAALTGTKALIAKQFIMACAGHARSLEFVSQAIQEEVQLYVPLPVSSEEPEQGHRLEKLEPVAFSRSINARLIEAFGLNNPTRPQYVTLSPARLRPALLQESVRFDDSPDEKGSTYIELMRESCYVNSEFANLASTQFIPEVSGIQLMLYGHAYRALDNIARYLYNMLSIEANFDRRCFEKFHAYFELIRFTLLDTTSQNLLALYPNALFNPKLWQPEAYAISMSKWTLELDRHSNFDERAGTASACQKIVISPKWNPGFDGGIQTKDVMLAIETCWPEQGSSTISLDDIRTKRKLLPDSAILIVLAYCKLGPMVAAANLPANTMVLGWEQLRELYGPALAWVKCLACTSDSFHEK